MLTDVVLPLNPWTVATALLIHCCLAVGQTPNYCARFEFPDLSDQTLTAPEGSLVNVSVRLVFKTFPTSPFPKPPTPINNDKDDEGTKCLDRERIVLGVSKVSSSDNHHKRDCFLRVTTTAINTGGFCQSFTKHRCRCTVGGVAVGRGDAAGGGGGRTLQLTVQLTRWVGKRDVGWWRWWTRDDVAPPASVFLGVSEKVPEDKENAPNQQSNQPNNINTDDNNDVNTGNSAREVSEPQHPSTVPSGIALDETENTTDHDNTSSNSSDNHKNPNAEVEDGEKNKNGGGDDPDDNDDDTKTAAAADGSAMDVSYVGAIVAGVNISTVFVIAIIIFIARRACCKHRRRELSPRPCSLNAILTEQRRNTMSPDNSYSAYRYGKRVSTSSFIYDEIPSDAIKKALITTDTSLYLHPVECFNTTPPTTPTTPTTPTPITTTASAVTSTTITFSK